MLSEGQKRRANLQILDRLRSRMPERPKEDEMNAMFDLASEGELGEEGVESSSPPEEGEEEKKKKKKGPKLEPQKVDQFKKGFKSVF